MGELKAISTGFTRTQMKIADLSAAKPEIQIRDALDEQWIEDLQDELEAGGKIHQHLVVFADAGVLWLADGHHRLEAAIRAGLTDVPAEIRQGTKKDAQLFNTSKSCPNNRHGNRYTQAEKQKAIMRTIELEPRWSDRRVAEHCGVNHRTVASARESATTKKNGTSINSGEKTKGKQDDALSWINSPPEKREGRDGKRYSTSRVTPEEKAVELYQTDTPLEEVAAITGLSLNQIQEARRKAGVDSRKTLAKKRGDEAARLYESGLSVSEIAEKTGLKTQSVYSAIKTRGVRSNKSQGRTPPNTKKLISWLSLIGEELESKRERLPWGGLSDATKKDVVAALKRIRNNADGCIKAVERSK